MIIRNRLVYPILLIIFAIAIAALFLPGLGMEIAQEQEKLSRCTGNCSSGQNGVNAMTAVWWSSVFIGLAVIGFAVFEIKSSKKRK